MWIMEHVDYGTCGLWNIWIVEHVYSGRHKFLRPPVSGAVYDLWQVAVTFSRYEVFQNMNQQRCWARFGEMNRPRLSSSE
jgi:hypothetical protein